MNIPKFKGYHEIWYDNRQITRDGRGWIRTAVGQLADRLSSEGHVLNFSSTGPYTLAIQTLDNIDGRWNTTDEFVRSSFDRLVESYPGAERISWTTNNGETEFIDRY